MATFNNPGQLPIFPGFVHEGVIAPTLQAMVVAFHSDYLGALNRAPMQYIKVADVGTYVMQGIFEARVPMQLPGSLAFEPFVDGQNHFQQLHVAAPAVKSAPFRLNFEWSYVIEMTDAGVRDVKLADYYGPKTLPKSYVDAGKAHKARMLGDLRNVAYGTSAQALTIPQPGYPLGIALYTDGSTTPAHFSHPFRKDSQRFVNLYLTAGKFDADALITTQSNMANIPHPTIPNLPAGYETHHIKGPTWMRKPFYNVALQTLQLAVASGSGAAAVTNIASLEKLRELGESSFIGASGVGPVTYHIDPTMDAHPLVAGANQGKHFWEAIDGSPDCAPWANFIAPDVNFTPMVKLLGDGSENAIKTGKIQMFGELHAGIGAGWPGGVALYYEG
jgi:hypothetical protein